MPTVASVSSALGAGTALALLVIAKSLLGLDVHALAQVVAVVAAAVLSGVVGWRYDGQGILPAMLWLACLGVVLCVIDLAHHRLPDPLVAALIGGGVALLVVAAVRDGQGAVDLGRAVVASGAVLVVGVLGMLAAGSGIGRGDATFSAALALYLGARGWTAVALGFLLASVLLAAAAVSVVAVRGGGPHRRLAAGPSLFLGAVGAVLALAPGG